MSTAAFLSLRVAQTNEVLNNGAQEWVHNLSFEKTALDTHLLFQ